MMSKNVLLSEKGLIVTKFKPETSQDIILFKHKNHSLNKTEHAEQSTADVILFIVLPVYFSLL